MSSEKVPIEEAMRRLIQVDATNTSKINKLEGQVDEILKASTEFRNRTGKSSTSTTDTTPGHTLTATTDTTTSMPGHTFQTTPYLKEPEANYEATTPTASPLKGVKHCIIVPPSSAAPVFHGKHSESPTQFLIRVQEYAESVHAWDRPTLLNGISQFLREPALEWYCQLRMSHRRPQTWVEFADLFLTQFNSPVRKARQEQEWHECQQKENETINEFLVRLRALWREQKPNETEADLVKHLFCRMRNDLLNMLGISCNASLDEVIAEAQQIEEILYRRAKNKRYNEDYSRTKTPGLSNEYSLNDYPRDLQDYEANVITPSRYLNNRIQTTVDSSASQQLNSYGCSLCGAHEHLTRDCPTQYRDHRQERSTPNPKNYRGALDERTSRAPM